MPEPQITQLLDRAVHHAPPMHLTGEAMLAAGKGRVRRRRAAGVGGALAAAAVVAALWGGLGGGSGLLTGTTEIRPATTLWEPGETVEGTLFDGLQTVDREQVGHSYAAELSRTSGEGPVTLVLSDGGDVVEKVPSASPVPGLDVFAGERMTVAVWAEPDGVLASVPLVGPRDPGGPADVQHAEVGGEQLAYAVWSADVVPLPEQLVDVYLMGRDRTVALSGTPVRWAGSRTAGHRLHAFADERRGVVGYRVDDEEPVLAQLGDRPAQVFSSGGVASDGTETRVLLLPEGSEMQGTPDEDDRGVGWIGTKLLDRPVVMVVREDAGERPPSDVEFTLGGEAYSFSGYVQDLTVLDVDGAALVAQPGARPGEVALWRRDADEPEVTFGEETGVGGALATQPVGGSLVALADGWDAGASVLAEARVEVTEDGATRWVAPTDVAQVALDDGRLVTLLAVDAEEGLEVAGVGLERDGDVERWDPPVLTAGGVELRAVDGVEVPYVDGRALPRIDQGAGSAFRHYAGADGQASYLVLAGSAGPHPVPVVAVEGAGAAAAPQIVRGVAEQVVDGIPVSMLTLSGGRAADGSSQVLAVAVQNAGPEGSANTWQLAGEAEAAHVVLDPGLVVSLGQEQGVWILYPQGSVDRTEIQAGTIGGTVLEVVAADGVSTLVAVLEQGAGPRLVGDVEGALDPMATVPVPGRAVEISTWTVQLPEGVTLADRGAGLDTDGDGQADILLQPRD
ncbi:MAG: hypothetical protein DCC50_00985 [Acidobacteria bacterium]|nr:MAG: hypothetical protein DCC50_00985 [Acidobacteriota bacterium]